jgi:acetylornithine/N-succinyldiaminopimelate aminotransferase
MSTASVSGRIGRDSGQHAGPQPPATGARLAGPGGKIIHSCNYYHVPNQETAGRKTGRVVWHEQRVFLLHRLEANEAALKLARKFGHDKGIDRPEIVVYEKAFHGRSIATLSATGNEKIQKGFEPWWRGFIRVPINDMRRSRRRPKETRTWLRFF